VSIKCEPGYVVLPPDGTTSGPCPDYPGGPSDLTIEFSYFATGDGVEVNPEFIDPDSDHYLFYRLTISNLGKGYTSCWSSENRLSIRIVLLPTSYATYQSNTEDAVLVLNYEDEGYEGEPYAFPPYSSVSIGDLNSPSRVTLRPEVFPESAEYHAWAVLEGNNQTEVDFSNNMYKQPDIIKIQRSKENLTPIYISTKIDSYYDKGDTYCALFKESAVPEFGNGAPDQIGIADQLNNVVQNEEDFMSWLLTYRTTDIYLYNYWYHDNAFYYYGVNLRDDDSKYAIGGISHKYDSGIKYYIQPGGYYLRCWASPFTSGEYGVPKDQPAFPFSYSIAASLNSNRYSIQKEPSRSPEHSEGDILNSDGSGVRELILDGPVLESQLQDKSYFDWYYISVLE